MKKNMSAKLILFLMVENGSRLTRDTHVIRKKCLVRLFTIL